MKDLVPVVDFAGNVLNVSVSGLTQSVPKQLFSLLTESLETDAISVSTCMSRKRKMMFIRKLMCVFLYVFVLVLHVVAFAGKCLIDSVSGCV